MHPFCIDSFSSYPRLCESGICITGISLRFDAKQNNHQRPFPAGFKQALTFCRCNPANEMKLNEISPAVAGSLAVVNPFHPRKTVTGNPVAVDIVVYCCAIPTRHSVDSIPPLKDRWLRYLLPGALPNARILAYEHALDVLSQCKTADDIQGLVFGFLSTLLAFRRTTKTVGKFRLPPSQFYSQLCNLHVAVLILLI